MKIIPKFMMTVSGIIFLLFGLSISFYPQATGRILGTASQYGTDLLLMKVVGGLFIGYGVINVMVRKAATDGKFGKPVTLGNAIVNLIIAGQFLKFNFSQDGVGGHYWIIAVIFSALTIGFISLFFTASKPE